MKNKLFLTVLLLVFFIAVICGRTVSKQSLASKNQQYSVETVDNQSNKKVTFYCQRFDTNTFQVTNSEGMVYISRLDDQLKNKNTLTFGLPNDMGLLSLQGSMLPFGKGKLQLVRSERYRQLDDTSKVTTVTPLSNLKESKTPVESEDKVKNIKLQLTPRQVDKIIADFGKWLYFSHYAKNAVVVNELFAQYQTNLDSPSILTVKTSQYTILARVIGDDNTDVSALRANDNYNYTLLGNNMSSSHYEDFQSRATYRLYHLRSKKHQYYNSIKDEETDLLNGSSDYVDFYKNQVNGDKSSYQIVLSDNGTVYYQKNFKPSQTLSDNHFIEAPEDMQKAYHKLLDNINK